MNVLIVSQHFPPDTPATGRRAMDFAQELTARGHAVTVVTGLPHHPAVQGGDKTRHLRPGLSREEGYQVRRVGVWRTPWTGRAQRMLTYASFALAAVWQAVRLARRADVVVAISPLPTGYVGMLAAKLHRRPFIFDLQDVWPESARVCGVLREGPLLRFLQRLEAVLYRGCSVITVISPGFRRYLTRRGLSAERVQVLHNGVETALFDGAVPDRAFLVEHDLEGKFLVLYFGNVGLAQHLVTLLQAAEALRHEPDFAFVIMGDGVDKANLVRWAREHSLSNCTFIPTQPRGRLPGIVANAHVLAVMLRRSELFTITVPSKLYECLAAGKPVVCTVPGDAATIVADARAGLVLPPEDPTALVQAIRQIRAEYDEFKVQAKAARLFVFQHYSRERIGADFEALCRSVMRRPHAIPGQN